MDYFQYCALSNRFPQTNKSHLGAEVRQQLWHVLFFLHQLMQQTVHWFVCCQGDHVGLQEGQVVMIPMLFYHHRSYHLKGVRLQIDVLLCLYELL